MVIEVKSVQMRFYDDAAVMTVQSVCAGEHRVVLGINVCPAIRNNIVTLHHLIIAASGHPHDTCGRLSGLISFKNKIFPFSHKLHQLSIITSTLGLL